MGTEVELDAYTVPPLSILEQVLILQGKYNEVMQARIIDQMLQEHSMKVLLAALEQPESKIRYTTSPYKINLDTEEIIMGDSIITYDNELGQLGIKTDTKYKILRRPLSNTSKPYLVSKNYPHPLPALSLRPILRFIISKRI